MKYLIILLLLTSTANAQFTAKATAQDSVITMNRDLKKERKPELGYEQSMVVIGTLCAIVVITMFMFNAFKKD